MAHPEHFDVVILGSGQGGKLLAWDLGRSGKKVAVVERRWVGGSCPAVACLPSKNELWSARGPSCPERRPVWHARAGHQNRYGQGTAPQAGYGRA
ncbi:FAD-dependent oxidoreductase [Bradyrhizobium sp. Gha]|uniref:FAD-dependent oxidoreductase n=1 Tax=Bradyrhizobium sp. Gha TaxID=1855318 RepID=UPI0024C01EB0|nr:FAD-dependent oxidoreductase [Bradyrhizobium sp. Gha]